MTRKVAQVLSVAMMLVVGTRHLRSEGQTPGICSVREMVPAQVRLVNCGTTVIVANGMARSATLRRVIDRIGQLQGIVYVEDRRCLTRSQWLAHTACST
jgi:hypothetical protein